MIPASERRTVILKLLCRRRHDTIENLAAETGVSAAAGTVTAAWETGVSPSDYRQSLAAADPAQKSDEK